MMTRMHWIAAVSVIASLVASGASASAEVYVSSPAGRLLVLDGSGAVVRVIGESGGLVAPYAIAVDARRQILLADHAAGRIVRYAPDGSNASVVASNIPKADGLTLAPSGDLYLVSRDDRALFTRTRVRTAGGDATATRMVDVWMVPNGANLPVRLASLLDSLRLAQAGLLASGPHTGDLIVLSSQPGFIARFERTGAAQFSRQANLVSDVPGEPTGMVVTRTGGILVSTSDGRVLHYSDTGQRIADFASGLPAGASRVTANFDGIVHVTPVGGGSVIRFTPYAERLADLSVPSMPVAAAITDACVPTPVGQNVVVSPAVGVNVIFDNVVQAGLTCLETTALGAGVTTTPNGNTIPSFARKLHEDAGFVVYDLTTTALHTDSIAPEFFSHNPDARVLHAHGSGQVMEDVTVLVTPDDPRTRVPDLSEFVVYLDTRPSLDVLLLKLDRLDGFVTEGIVGVGPDLLDTIQSAVQQAAGFIGAGGPDSDPAQATATLVGLKQIVRQSSGEGIPNAPGPDNEGNVSGILLSLADTLIFHLSL